MIQKKLKTVIKRRSKEEIIEKHKRIGELLEMPQTPLHELAWKEMRLDLGTGDCYPFVDVLLRIVEKVAEKPKKTRAKKKVKDEDGV